MVPMTLKIINNANVLAADTIAFSQGGAEAMRIKSDGIVSMNTLQIADNSTGARADIQAVDVSFLLNPGFILSNRKGIILPYNTFLH
jgi:hypothetical protein